MDKELLRYKSMDAEKLAAELDYFFRQNYEKYSSYFHNPSEKEKDLYNKLMQGRFVGIKKLLEDMGQGEHSYLINRLTQHENNYPMDLYLIYQVKRDFARDYLFENYDVLAKRGLKVDSDHYELTYSAELIISGKDYDNAQNNKVIEKPMPEFAGWLTAHKKGSVLR